MTIIYRFRIIIIIILLFIFVPAVIFFIKWFNITELYVIIGLVVGLIPSVVTIHQKNTDREEDYKKWLIQNKEACAIELVTTFTKFLITDKNMPEQKKIDGMQERLKHIIPALIVWASPSLLMQWDEMTSTQPSDDINNITRRGERFLRTVRRDIGNLKDENLKPGALWATLLTPDEKQKAYDACKGEKYDTL